jgi:predicted nucleic acid-binding protein
MVDKNLIKGYISAISINNIYYITRKQKGRSEAERIVDKVLKDFKIISLTYEILKLSRTVDKKDFEDVIQYFSALQKGCEYIITRNTKDFLQKEIKVIKPADFIKEFESMNG